ncbi:hypothetical protein DBR00_11625 [Pseudomonas sp. HMWF032]|nr:hypothetical protein DBR00_11625 [Pseudomonas sp. HMWF032]PTT85377.1 hypothetical protein DBR41_04210 [Pseudomonas sp. HMWF010]
MPIALFFGCVALPEFAATTAIWLVVSVLLIVGPESISELSIGVASIKRDVQSARDAKEEAEQIRDNLRSVTKLITEAAYITAGSSFLAQGQSPARSRIEEVLGDLESFAEEDPEKRRLWCEKMQAIFNDRATP